MSIGSDPENDVVIDDTTVSRRHAVIHRNLFGKLSLTDLDSTNGTYVNGARVQRRTTIEAGVDLRIGAARLRIARKQRGVIVRIGRLAAMLAVAGVAGFFLTIIAIDRYAPKPEPRLNSPKIAPSPAPVVLETTAPVVEESPISESMTQPEPPWLAAVNRYRGAAKLAPVAEDSTMSEGDSKHVAYLIHKYAGHISPGGEVHTEVADDPNATPEGKLAAENSNIDEVWGSAAPVSPSWAVDDWMEGPFHRMRILSPLLKRVGYAELCENNYCAAALNVLSGVERRRHAVPLEHPIEFPSEHAEVSPSMVSLQAEWPNPASACEGYTMPVGLPITLQLGPGIDARLVSYALKRDGEDIESCGVDADGYAKEGGPQSALMSNAMREAGAIVIVPRSPLVPGAPYQVSVTANDKQYEWSFSVGSNSTK